jgi:hypothetical protein
LHLLVNFKKYIKILNKSKISALMTTAKPLLTLPANEKEELNKEENKLLSGESQV